MELEGKPIRARPEENFPRIIPISEEEMDQTTLWTLVKLIYNTIARLFHDPVGMILGSTFILIMVWGTHGKLELLRHIWKDWTGPGSGHPPAQILPWIPWDQEWISFVAGIGLLVLLPILLIKHVYKQDLRDYGLGPPRRDRWKLTLLSAGALLGGSLPMFWKASKITEMRKTYPLFHDFHSFNQFAVYEMGYLLFFVAIEFIFRGYLLFGLFQLRDQDAPPGVHGEQGPLVFGYYSIFISMLSYTAWHLGKPFVELWGTLIWGLVAGTVALATRTIWHIILVHWLLNVFMDLLIWQQG